MKKKLISLLLAVVMILGMMPVASASETAPFTAAVDGEPVEVTVLEDYTDQYGMPYYHVAYSQGKDLVLTPNDGMSNAVILSDMITGWSTYTGDEMPGTNAILPYGYLEEAGFDASSFGAMCGVEIAEGSIAVLIEVMGVETVEGGIEPRAAYTLVAEAVAAEDCDHTGTATSTEYTPAGNETHTVTTKCECGAQIGEPTTEACKDGNMDGKCNKCGGPVAVPVGRISLGAETIEANLGDNPVTLDVFVTPPAALASNPVAWSSSDENVATVADGVVTFVGAGTATITAAAGGKSATCVVTVKVAVNSVTLSQEQIEVTMGAEPVTLTAAVDPENATDNTVVWTTSDDKVATVDNGVVTFVGIGTATITATAGNKSDSCEVTVRPDSLIALDAPVLDADKAVRNISYIILAAPTASAQDTAATVQYRMHDGVAWGEWQESPRFNGLTAGTTYQFQAKYVAKDTDLYTDSVESNAISLQARESLEVTFRLTGSSLPSEAIFFSTASKLGNYFGATYQTWIKTEQHSLTSDMRAKDLTEIALKAHNFTYNISGNSITAPAYFGGHVLDHNKATNAGGNNSQIRWTVTIIRDGVHYDNRGLTVETVSNPDSALKSISTELQHGDSVIISFSWASGHENISGSYRSGSTAYLQNYLKAPDFSIAEWQEIDAVEEIIYALVVTPESGAAIAAARKAYNDLPDLQRANVEADALAYLEYAEASIAEYNNTGKLILLAPELSSTAAEISCNSITLTAAPASKQDPAASVQYAFSSDSGKTWSAWQSSTVFSGLSAKKTYSFKAKYVPTDSEGAYLESAASETVAIRTTTGEFINVRVIGGTYPTKKIGSVTDVSGYNGAVYNTWLATSPYELTEGVTDADDVAKEMLAANGFVIANEGTNSTSITAPAEFGGAAYPTSRSAVGSRCNWFVTVIRGEETVAELKNISGTCAVKAGDLVVVHYVYNDKNETVSGSEKTIVQYYLQAPDFSPAEYAAKENVIALIDAIGETITLESEAAITAARTAYDALSDTMKTYVTNSAKLLEAEAKFGALADMEALTAPEYVTPAVVGTTVDVMTSGCIEDPNAYAEYRISENNTDWSEWQRENVFTRLKAGTTYYVQARFVPTTEGYKVSDPSEAVTVTTAAAIVYEVRNREEWIEAISTAPTDSTAVVIKVKNDITICDVGIDPTKLPDSSNITVVGDGGKLFAAARDAGNTGIWIGSNCNFTMKDLCFYNLAMNVQHKYDCSFGFMINFNGSDSVVNFDNVFIYGDGTLIGDNPYAGTTADNNTVNIYSGIFNQVTDRVFAGSGIGALNFIPNGNIIIKGKFTAPGTVSLIPQDGTPVKSGSFSKDFVAYTAMKAEELAGGVLDATGYCGLRIITDENTASAAPEKLAAPGFTADDVTINVNKVSIDIKTSDKENVVMQWRWRKVGTSNTDQYHVWKTPPMTFDPELEENTEYYLQVRFESLDADCISSDYVELLIKTGYNNVELAAPVLGEAAEKTETSVTLTPVAACTVAKANATAQYRMSADGVNWGEWSDNLVYDNLKPGRYYFQARYFSETAPYVSSQPSNTLEVTTVADAVNYGDLNGDGDINDDDVSLLRKYLAGAAVDMNAAAADVNTDGAVNLNDLIILRRYIKDWDGFGFLPYVPAA